MEFDSLVKTLKDEASKVAPSDKSIAQKESTFFKNSNKEDLKGKKQDRKERKKYARHIFWFTWIWCAAIFVLMILTGRKILSFDNSVIITLITTTTANILALFVIVAKYLFFREVANNQIRKNKSSKNKNKVTQP